MEEVAYTIPCKLFLAVPVVLWHCGANMVTLVCGQEWDAGIE